MGSSKSTLYINSPPLGSNWISWWHRYQFTPFVAESWKKQKEKKWVEKVHNSPVTDVCQSLHAFENFCYVTADI